jgi:phage-related protein
MARSFPRLRPWSRPREALRLLLSGATARPCLPVALVVGTVLSLVNQGDVIAQGAVGAVVVLKVLANYLIPFLTSSTGALLAVRQRPVRHQ